MRQYNHHQYKYQFITFYWSWGKKICSQPSFFVQYAFAAPKQDFASWQCYLKASIILLLESRPHSLAFLPQLIWQGLFFTKPCSIIQPSALFRYLFRLLFLLTLYPPSTFSVLLGPSFSNAKLQSKFVSVIYSSASWHMSSFQNSFSLWW